MKVDLRSESETELATLEGLLRDAVKGGVDEEMAAARERGMAGGSNVLNLKINVLGVRPGGRTPGKFSASRRFAGRRRRNSATVRDASAPRPTPIFRSRWESRPFRWAPADEAAARTPSKNGMTRRAGNSACSASR